MASKVLVVGSGAIGLRTALELLRRKIPVVLRSPRPPLHPSTCSMGAGGLWMPYHCDDARVDGWAIETLDELLKLSSSSSPSSSESGGGGGRPLAEIVPTVILKRDHGGPTVEHFVRRNGGNSGDGDGDGNGETKRDVVEDEPLPGWSADSRLAFQHLTTEMLWWQNAVHGLRLPSLDELSTAGYKHAWLFHPPIVDCPRMLERMLDEVTSHPLVKEDGEAIDVDTGRHYGSLEEMVEDAAEMGCDGVANCTGLGSRQLCSDESMTGGRGVLLHYDRRTAKRRQQQEGPQQPNDCAILTEEAPWASEQETCYVIPRGDTLCVGGTYFEGDEEEGVREGERTRLTENARRMGIDTDRSETIEEWTGFRPVRQPAVRLEIDEEVGGGGTGVRVVHNYGHGGSGWTVFVGAAREAAALLAGK